MVTRPRTAVHRRGQLAGSKRQQHRSPCQSTALQAGQIGQHRGVSWLLQHSAETQQRHSAVCADQRQILADLPGKRVRGIDQGSKWIALVARLLKGRGDRRGAGQGTHRKLECRARAGGFQGAVGRRRRRCHHRNPHTPTALQHLGGQRRPFTGARQQPQALPLVHFRTVVQDGHHHWPLGRESLSARSGGARSAPGALHPGPDGDRRDAGQSGGPASRRSPGSAQGGGLGEPGPGTAQPRATRAAPADRRSPAHEHRDPPGRSQGKKAEFTLGRLHPLGQAQPVQAAPRQAPVRTESAPAAAAPPDPRPPPAAAPAGRKTCPAGTAPRWCRTSATTTFRFKNRFKSRVCMKSPVCTGARQPREPANLNHPAVLRPAPAAGRAPAPTQRGRGATGARPRHRAGAAATGDRPATG